MKPKLCLFAALIVLVLISGCSLISNIPKEKRCNQDSDCACGTNIETRECFYGNKAYVNTEEQCPDFCTGIAGNLEMKCTDNECQKVKKQNTPEPKSECNMDSDCAPKECCHPTSCIPTTQKAVCEAILCSLECRPNTLDCGNGYCSCDNGKCLAHFK